MSITVAVRNAQGTSTNFSSSNFTNLQSLLATQKVYIKVSQSISAIEYIDEIIKACEILINVETSDDDEDIEVVYRLLTVLKSAQETSSEVIIF